MAASGFVVIALGGSLTWLIMNRKAEHDPATGPTISPTISPTINPTISPTISPTIRVDGEARRAAPGLPQANTPNTPNSATTGQASDSAHPAAATGTAGPCSGVKQWLNVESVHAVSQKDNTYKITIVLADKLDRPVSVSILGSAMELNDDAHNPSPNLTVDFPLVNDYQPSTSYAKTAYNNGMKITGVEPQPVTFHSWSVHDLGKHVSLSAHLIIAEDHGNDTVVAAHTVLRCADLPVE
jgi:hypothetical protein